MSHLKCLEIAKSKNWDHLLILEDDITFLDPKVFVNQLNKFLSLQKDYDVLLVAGNNVSDYKKIGDYCVKVTKCQTTTGYLVKNHYFDTLIQNYKEGIQNLMKNQDKPGLFAIDQYWFKLQGQHKWYLIIPLTVTQREDYSNIEKRHTNYNHVMLDLDKPWLQRPPPVKYAPKLEIFPNP
jgi:GR25 family glycosyltransferase involved in LPS biosynthesis